MSQLLLPPQPKTPESDVYEVFVQRLLRVHHAAYGRRYQLFRETILRFVHYSQILQGQGYCPSHAVMKLCWIGYIYRCRFSQEREAIAMVRVVLENYLIPLLPASEFQAHDT